MYKLLILLTLGAVGYIYFVPYQQCRNVNIETLIQHSSDFGGRVVTVSGSVKESAGILGIGGFVLTDGTGDIVVLSSSGVPSYGKQIDVEGKFQQVFNVGMFNQSAIVESKVNNRSSLCMLIP